jgi:hypothetical protein
MVMNYKAENLSVILHLSRGIHLQLRNSIHLDPWEKEEIERLLTYTQFWKGGAWT